MRQVLRDRFERPRRAVALTMVGFFAAATPQASAAVAAPSEAESDPAALFSRAETLYREGRYEEAIEILEELVEGHPEAILRFNLGRAYESAGLLGPAIAAYREYLEAAPDAPDRGSVVARIERLESRVPTESDPEPEPQPAPVELPTPPTEVVAPRPVIAPWIVAGVGGVGLIVGGVFGGLSLSRSSEAADSSTDQVRALEAHRNAQSFGRVSTGALIVGGVLAVAGVTWGIVATTRRRRQAVRTSMSGLMISF